MAAEVVLLRPIGLAFHPWPCPPCQSSPIAFVAQNPIELKLPVADYRGDLVARAGDDQCLSASAETTNVRLDGSASQALSGTIVRYLWHLPAVSGCEYLEGQQVSVPLPNGVFSIELEITDDAGNVSRDTLIVSIG